MLSHYLSVQYNILYGNSALGSTLRSHLCKRQPCTSRYSSVYTVGKLSLVRYQQKIQKKRREIYHHPYCGNIVRNLCPLSPQVGFSNLQRNPGLLAYTGIQLTKSTHVMYAHFPHNNIMTKTFCSLLEQRCSL